MSGYVKKVVVRREFEGDSVVVTLSPIRWPDRLDINDLIPADVEARKRPEELKKVTRASIDIMSRYVLSVEGLFDLEKSPVEKDAVSRDAYFFDLAGDVFREWYSASLPQDPTPPAAVSDANSKGLA